MHRHSAEKKKALIRSTVAVPQVLEQGLNPDHPSEVFTGVTGHGGALQQDEAGGKLLTCKKSSILFFPRRKPRVT